MVLSRFSLMVNLFITCCFALDISFQDRCMYFCYHGNYVVRYLLPNPHYMEHLKVFLWYYCWKWPLLHFWHSLQHYQMVGFWGWVQLFHPLPWAVYKPSSSALKCCGMRKRSKCTVVCLQKNSALSPSTLHPICVFTSGNTFQSGPLLSSYNVPKNLEWLKTG